VGIKYGQVDVEDAALAAFATMTKAIGKESGHLIEPAALFLAALHVMAMSLAFQPEDQYEGRLSTIDEQLNGLVARYRTDIPEPMSEH
jgi:hypothetical protein